MCDLLVSMEIILMVIGYGDDVVVLGFEDAIGK